MEKMKMESIDGVQNNVEKIAELFPNCITEALDTEKSTPEKPVYKKAINWKMLHQMLSPELADENEAYEMTWVGKKAAIVEANKPIRKTLRPCPEESVNWDTTENLYIEGDNLEVLKLLQESYLGKVKMIYIDPPYNTGQDFIYKDNYSEEISDYVENASLVDESGNRFFKNSDLNGRFHSNWCSMIYKLLLLSRNLLTEDGVIFISIDDRELFNLKKICDEVFGEHNFVNCIAVKMSEASGVKMNHAKTRFPKIKEYILFYKREGFQGFKTIDKYLVKEWDRENNLFLDNFSKTDREKLLCFQEKENLSENDITEINDILSKAKVISLAKKMGDLTLKDEKKKNEWLFENAFRIFKTAGSSSLLKKVKSLPEIPNQDVAASLSNDGILFYYVTNFNQETKQPRLQVLFADESLYKNPCDFWQDIKTTGAIANEGGVPYANGKKPLKLLKRLIKMNTGDDDIILDYFSGSSSTAHALLEQNEEDHKNRHFIMVQIDENLDESQNRCQGQARDTIKETIKTLDKLHRPHILSELGKIRLLNVNQTLKDSAVDSGFRVLQLKDSNFNDVFYNPSDYSQGKLFELTSNIKEDRTDLDLFFGCILDWGLPLSLPYSTESIGGFKVHNYNNGDLIACFEENVSEELVKEIASRQPMRAVFRDSSFGNSPEKINVFEIFKKYMPEDADDISKRVKVI